MSVKHGMVVVVLAVLGLACTERAARVDQGAVVRIGWKGSPDTLHPGTALLAEAYTIFGLVYDSIYRLGLDGAFRLSLAKEAEVSDDGTVWTFRLHEGVEFHDGRPLTARDVVFSYLFYHSRADFPLMKAYTTYFQTVEAPDDDTVVITLDQPIANLDSQLGFLYILPEHIWSSHAQGRSASEFQNTDMIGSGPFKMAQYRQNEFIRLEANHNHFAMPPRIDGVVFQTFQNEDALVQAVRTGQVDMITELPNTAVPALRNDPNVQLAKGLPLLPDVTDIIINQISPENCPEAEGKCTGHPALQDRRVRLALAHATDKQQLIDIVLLGLGTPGLTLIPDGLGAWHNRAIEDYPYDPETANRILDEAGYLDRNGDGVRETPDGESPLRFRLNWPRNIPEAPRTAQLLSRMWRTIGIETQLQALDPEALTAQCCPAFDYDLMIWGWTSDPDPNLLLGVMTTREISTGVSETGYSNPEYDRLYREQAAELDPDRRRDLVWQMQRLVFDDVVYIIPYYAQAIQAYRVDRFRGWITDQPKLALADVWSLVAIEEVEP